MRKHAALIVELSLLAVAIAVAAVVTLASPGASKQAPLFTPTVLGSQPAGAVVLAHEDKDLAVGLALKPQAKGLLAVATVLGQDGAGAAGLQVSFTVVTRGGAAVSAAGDPGTLGTYQALLATGGRPVRASVTVTGPGSSGKPLCFQLPASWPPRPAAALMRHVDDAYTHLKTLVTHEQLASSPTRVLNTVYRAIAPSTLSIDSANGNHAIIIGGRRWDKRPGSPWKESPQSPPVQAVAPFWSGIVQDATVVGSTTIHGRPAWLVAFAAPQIPAFFQIAVDKADDRTLDLRMTASAHFMHHRYGPFDSPLTIRPPK